MINEMMRNGSGYVDMTAYNGMTNATPGEIWTQMDRDEDRYLLLAVNGKVVTALKLTNRDYDGSIQVNCHDTMYSNPAMISYIFSNNLGGYVKTLPKKEFEAVQKAVADVLGLAIMDKDTATLRLESVNLKEEYDKACEKNGFMELELGIAKNKVEELEDELAACKPYRLMYHELIDKLIAAKAGAVI